MSNLAHVCVDKAAYVDNSIVYEPRNCLKKMCQLVMRERERVFVTN